MIYLSLNDENTKAVISSYIDLHECLESTRSIIDEYMIDDMLLEGTSDTDKKNIFEKIGETVINIYNKFMDFIKNIFKSINDRNIKGKSNIIKAEKMIKRHPEFKNEIITSIKDGNLSLDDIKSLDELDKAASEIANLALRENIDPKSLRGKWEKAKLKAKNLVNSKTASNSIALATSALSLTTGIVYFKNRSKAEKQSLKNSEEVAKKMNDALKNLEHVKSDVTTDVSATVASIFSDYVAQTTGSIKSVTDRTNTIVDGINKKIDELERTFKSQQGNNP